jgi:DNA-binding transcriptional MerR regulator
MGKAMESSTQPTIAAAASFLGTAASTLRNWDQQGKLKLRRHPINGHRLYHRAVTVPRKGQIEGTE